MGQSGLVLRQGRSGPGHGLQAATDGSGTHREAGCVGGSGSKAHQALDLMHIIKEQKGGLISQIGNLKPRPHGSGCK
jgi:hypothetical protein